MAASSFDFDAALDPFDSAESARLRRYVTNADELARCSFLGEKLSFRFQSTRGQPYEIDMPLDDEAIAAWLLRFRRLHLKGRSTSATFSKMHSLIDQHTRANPDGEALRQALERAKRATQTAHNREGLQLHVDDGQIKPGQALDDWLNAVYFHDDEDKLERVDALRPFGMHLYLALGAGRDLSSVYLGFATYIIRPVTEEPALCPPAES